jgi:hypothetical protein
VAREGGFMMPPKLQLFLGAAVALVLFALFVFYLTH